jgi:hypothetical protein
MAVHAAGWPWGFDQVVLGEAGRDAESAKNARFSATPGQLARCRNPFLPVDGYIIMAFGFWAVSRKKAKHLGLACSTGDAPFVVIMAVIRRLRPCGRKAE